MVGAVVVALTGCSGGSTPPPAPNLLDYRAILAGVSQRQACTRLDMSAAMTACRDDMVQVRDAMARLMPTLPHDPDGRLYNTASSARLRASDYLQAGCGMGDTVTPSMECSSYSRDATVFTENLLTAMR
ncbi:hypothetical protein GCM10010470_02280 [Saccharopolyspora taberi]|uniref:Uncharacterized protein n=2 Tax=Saccharopolyspora taberi TaxID=60895 RepID=A0ABN3V101_9PSEU